MLGSRTCKSGSREHRVVVPIAHKKVRKTSVLKLMNIFKFIMYHCIICKLNVIYNVHWENFLCVCFIRVNYHTSKNTSKKESIVSLVTYSDNSGNMFMFINYYIHYTRRYCCKNIAVVLT